MITSSLRPSKYSQPSSSCATRSPVRHSGPARRSSTSTAVLGALHVLAEVAEEERRHASPGRPSARRRRSTARRPAAPCPSSPAGPARRAACRSAGRSRSGRSRRGSPGPVASCQARSTSGLSASPAATSPRRSASAPQRRALGDHAVLGRRHAQHVDALAREQLQALVRVEARVVQQRRGARAATAR